MTLLDSDKDLASLITQVDIELKKDCLLLQISQICFHSRKTKFGIFFS